MSEAAPSRRVDGVTIEIRHGDIAALRLGMVAARIPVGTGSDDVGRASLALTVLCCFDPASARLHEGLLRAATDHPAP